MTEISQNDGARPNGGKQKAEVVEIGALREQVRTAREKEKAEDGGGNSNATKAADFIFALFARCLDESEITLMTYEWTAGLRVISQFRLYAHFLIEVLMKEQPVEDFELFFQLGARRPDGSFEPTRFGGFDTGTVHPTAYDPVPAAYWETSPGRYQAVWDWGKAIPVEASVARLEALIHEYGGMLGTHHLDSYLRVPWSINHKANYGGPEVKMLHDGITAKAKAWMAAQDR